MRLVKAAKAFPHAKFYNLSTAYITWYITDECIDKFGVVDLCLKKLLQYAQCKAKSQNAREQMLAHVSDLCFIL